MSLNNKKSIIFIHHVSFIGGASNSLLDIIKRINKEKYRVLVILPREGLLPDLLRKQGVEYRVIPLSVFYYFPQVKTISLENFQIFLSGLARLFALLVNSLGNIVCLLLIIWSEKPDTVVINSSSLLLSGFVARIARRRVIWHIREVMAIEKSWILQKFVAGILNYSASKVIVQSNFSLRNVSGLKIKNAIVVYNGVDLAKFSERVVPDSEIVRLGLNPGDKVIGLVGQIYKEKGWRVLLKAAFMLIQRFPRVKFIVSGSSDMVQKEDVKCRISFGWYREDTLFREAAMNMKLENNFIFLGQRRDTQDIFPLMSCFAYPITAEETFGRVLVEAMACGVPVVASDIGAVRELVKDNNTGLLVKPDDPVALAEALESIMVDGVLAKKMGETGRRRAKELFDIENTVSKLFRIYGL